MVETGVGLQTDVDRRPGGCLPGGMKEVLEPGDVEEDPLCVVEGHHPDGGLLLDVVPHQEEDLHQGVISVAAMREVVVLGDQDHQLEEVEEMTEEETEGLLRGADLLQEEALHPVVMKDDLMVEPGDVVVEEGLLRGEDLLRDAALLREGEDLPQDGEILLPDDSETILQDATMDLLIGVVTDLLLLLLHEMINPHRTNPLASLMKVGPRWPSVSRSNHSVWD